MSAGGKRIGGSINPEGLSIDDEDIFELNGLRKELNCEAVSPPEVSEEILDRFREAVNAVRVVRHGDHDLKINTSKDKVRLSFSWFELKVDGAPRARVLDVERFIRNHTLAFKLIEDSADTKDKRIASEPTQKLSYVWDHLCDQYAAIRHCIAPWGARVLPYVGSAFTERTLLNLEVMLNVRRWENLKEFTAFGTAFGGQIEGPFEKFMSSPDRRFRYYASVVTALHLGLK